MALDLRGRLKLGLRLVALAPAFAIGLPAQWVALKLGSPLTRHMPVIFHRYLCFVLGVRVIREGKLDPRRPLMIVSNHVSWLDIVIISSLFPVSFIAKSEVGTWPVVRNLARLQRSIFVERERRAKTAAVNAAIAERIGQGDAMVLFAEGTTSDGLRILPFRSALLGAAQAATAEAGEAVLQPLSIRYTHRGGLPIARAEMAEIAWYGDMDLGPHLAALLAGPGITVRVSLPDALPVSASPNRKETAKELETRVRQAFSGETRSFRGGELPLEEPNAGTIPAR
ncbi:MAG: 1-acyl-sn-glycerol-3-phosphate acyltransferase [Beijerinckiaceae bacterium]|jgi:1-acyl-sn-glycerol-3-phosphate acyltransferase|nr:1-acyl-sn-glycerol-3-phosphate acyltransferase [Beijerinckiaceae bacterium]